MGEAKRRGTLEQRIAQSIVLQQAEDARRAEERARIAAERRRQASERQKLLSPQERKEAVLVSSGHHTGLLLAAALAGGLGAASAPFLILDEHDGDSRA